MSKAEIFPHIPSQQQLDEEWRREQTSGPGLFAILIPWMIVFYTTLGMVAFWAFK